MSLIFKLNNDIFKTVYSNKLVLFSPSSNKGIILIPSTMQDIIESIDGYSSVAEISKKLQNNYAKKDIHTLINYLREYSVVYDTNKKDYHYPQLQQNQNTVFTCWLHITNQCNLRCSYCYISKSNNFMDINTGKTAINKLIHSAKTHGYPTIKIKFSGGEALLHFRTIIRIIEYANSQGLKHNINFQYVILTNGIILSDFVIKQLQQYNVSFAVSVDGLKRVHDRTRKLTNGSGSFNLVKRGISLLQKHNVSFNTSVTISAYNLDNIPDLTDYFLDLNIPFTYSFVRENRCSNINTGLDKEHFITIMKEAYRRIQKRPPNRSMLKGLLDRVSLDGPKLRACGIGNNYLVIWQDGSISTCQMMQTHIIGSIQKTDDLINLVRIKSLEYFTHQNKMKPTSCAHCQWRSVCCGGCPLVWTHNASQMFNCTIYKRLIPEVINTEAARILYHAKI